MDDHVYCGLLPYLDTSGLSQPMRGFLVASLSSCRHGDTKTMRQKARACGEIAIQRREPNGLATVWIHFAAASAKDRNFPDADNNLERARHFFRWNPSGRCHRGEGVALCGQGLIREHKSEILLKEIQSQKTRKATYHEDTLRIVRRVMDNSAAANDKTSYESFATLAQKLRQNNTAALDRQECYDILSRLHSRPFPTSVQDILAQCLQDFEAGDATQMLEHARTGKRIASSCKNPVAVAACLAHEALAHFLLGDFEPALQTADEAIRLYSRLPDWDHARSRAITTYGAGRICAHQIVTLEKKRRDALVEAVNAYRESLTVFNSMEEASQDIEQLRRAIEHRVNDMFAP